MMGRWAGKSIEIKRHDWKSQEGLTHLLLEAAKQRAQDVIIQSGYPILVKVDDEDYAITEAVLMADDLERISKQLSEDQAAISRLGGGNPIRTSTQFPDYGDVNEHGDPKQYRFRINMSGHYYEGGSGIQIVLRYIDGDPPMPSDVEMEREIVEASTPAQGLVCFAGKTGSGKTRSQAALIHNVMRGNTRLRGNILLYEDPIEYLYNNISSPCCYIAQHEVPTHIPSFADAIADCLRRNPSLVQIQELRETATVMAAVEASNTGLPIYATAHANTAAHVLVRLTQRFPEHMQDAAYADLLQTMHMVVSQVLVPRIGGGRICLREWFIFDEDARRELERHGRREGISAMRNILNRGEVGRSMLTTVKRHLERGTISTETAAYALRRYGYAREADQLRDTVNVRAMHNAVL